MKFTGLILILIFITAFLQSQAQESRYVNLADSADLYIKRGAWTQAENLIIEALREEPANFSNHLLLCNLGVVRMNKGNMPDALEAFDLGISMAPNSTVLLNNRAHLLMLLEKNEDAFADLDKSLKIDSLQEWPREMKAHLLALSGNLENALQNYVVLTKLYPSNPNGFIGTGRINEIKGDWDSAAANYMTAWEIEKQPETISLLVLIKIKQDKLSESADLIREGLSLFPDYAELYIWRGVLNRLNYLYEESEADRKMAIAKGADISFVNSYIPPLKR